MTDEDDWEDEDEMGLAAAFVLAFMVVSVSVAVVGAAIAWQGLAALRRVTRL